MRTVLALPAAVSTPVAPARDWGLAVAARRRAAVLRARAGLACAAAWTAAADPRLCAVVALLAVAGAPAAPGPWSAAACLGVFATATLTGLALLLFAPGRARLRAPDAIAASLLLVLAAAGVALTSA